MKYGTEIKIAKAVGKQDWDTLIGIQKKEIDLEGQNIYNLYWLAYSYEKKGQYDKAIIYAEKILEIEEENFDAIKILTIAYNKTNEIHLTYKYAKIGLKNLSSPISPPVSMKFVNFIKYFSFIPFFQRLGYKIEKDIKNYEKSNYNEGKWELWAKKYIEWYESTENP